MSELANRIQYEKALKELDEPDTTEGRVGYLRVLIRRYEARFIPTRYWVEFS